LERFTLLGLRQRLRTINTDTPISILGNYLFCEDISTLGPIRNLQLKTLSATEISLLWSIPSTHMNWKCKITKYTIVQSNSINNSIFSSTDVSSTTFSFNKLLTPGDQGKKYYFYLKISNAYFSAISNNNLYSNL
jgi:hypothetical protein